MTIDYRGIADDESRKDRIVKNSLTMIANLYGDSAHFVFELLQNAEDALQQHPATWHGPRDVAFRMESTALRVGHFGKPFDQEDVASICSVAETTKASTSIGKFGIGFKSVFSFTDIPEIHSGEADFFIEGFTKPVEVPKVERKQGETVILIPFKPPIESKLDIVRKKLEGLGATTLLFLHQIEGIYWRVEGGGSGHYLRKAKEVSPCIRRVTLMGERDGEPDVNEEWLIFSRPSKPGYGNVEIAFSIGNREESGRDRIQRVQQSMLTVFFPTVVETHLGFRIQGPYQTTPGRDSVLADDSWNVELVQETAALLVDSLESLKSRDLLDVAALQSLPIDRAKFSQDSMFEPLFDAVLTKLASDPFLPRADGGWTAAKNARIASTQELRELFDSKQLTALLDEPEEVHWLSGDIGRNTTPILYDYLKKELRVTELTPRSVLSALTKEFLEAQPAEWIRKLYEFLSGQTSLMSYGAASSIPLVRIDDGTHVLSHLDGQPQAFLPSTIKTDFPTVMESVCSTEKSLEFLKSLELSEPDPVDDVVRSIIPKYMRENVEVDCAEYEADVQRILGAFDTQHSGQKDKLIAGLKEASFVMAVDAGNHAQQALKPSDVYLATARLVDLFTGVAGIMLVDDSAYSCLKGERIRVLLEACGVARGLTPKEVGCTLTDEDRCELRIRSGWKRSTWGETLKDHTLRGLPELLALLPSLDAEEKRKRAKLLWEALREVDQRLRSGAFLGTYSWFYHKDRSAKFDAAFVRQLNTIKWVPDSEGELRLPEFILFEDLDWEESPVLTSKIQFQSPKVDQLACELGFDPKALEELKKRGLTSLPELLGALGEEKQSEPTVLEPGSSECADAPSIDESDIVEDGAENLTGDEPASTDQIYEPTSSDSVGACNDTVPPEAGTASGKKDQSDAGSPGGSAPGTTRPRKPGSMGGRPFISYIAVHTEEAASDPDDLDHLARTNLEAEAIKKIRWLEPEWELTPLNTPGFDLYQVDKQSAAIRWCEVKAMTGGLVNRAVGLSLRQWKFAAEHGEAYSLYVVEHAGTDMARLVKIQNPVGKARTFTFDRGWLDIAEVFRLPTDGEGENTG
jgi:hypothetical protein